MSASARRDRCRAWTEDRRRIGLRAYLAPGGPFASGTLARDVSFLRALARSCTDRRRSWTASWRVTRRTRCGPNDGWARASIASPARQIAIWGLTYKPGTDTLRRSSAVDLARWLVSQGAHVHVHDPMARDLPDDLRVTRTPIRWTPQRVRARLWSPPAGPAIARSTSSGSPGSRRTCWCSTQTVFLGRPWARIVVFDSSPWASQNDPNPRQSQCRHHRRQPGPGPRHRRSLRRRRGQRLLCARDEALARRGSALAGIEEGP